MWTIVFQDDSLTHTALLLWKDRSTPPTSVSAKKLSSRSPRWAVLSWELLLETGLFGGERKQGL